MGQFTIIAQDTFNTIQTDAGILVKNFNPANPNVQNSDIICATTGGITASCKPAFSDMFEDVDNAPNNTKEGKHLDGWDAKISTQCLGTSPQAIKLALGCADIDSNDATKIVPRAELKQTDFSDIWWIGDKANGGFVAVQLKNALSTEGFEIKTTKNGKGTINLSLTGHMSIQNQKEVPMVFYSVNPTGTGTGA